VNRKWLTNSISIIQWRLRDQYRRYREALAYARNRMTASQANGIIYSCQAAAGWYPLETFSVDRCLQTARDCHWQDHPVLESLVRSACARVADKWESTGHAADAAEDWALDLVGDYAAARGIHLTRHEDDPGSCSAQPAGQGEQEPDGRL
jgi:hypothetical protein